MNTTEKEAAALSADPLTNLQRLARMNGGNLVHSWTNEPFGVYDPATGEYWSVATDGKLLVAVRGLLPGIDVGRAGEDGAGGSTVLNQAGSGDRVHTAGRKVAPFLRQLPAASVVESVPLGLLRRWCLGETGGKPVWSEPCPACEGTSVSDYVVCTYCDGDGDVWPEARPAWFLGWLYDVLLIGRGLACLPVRNGGSGEAGNGAGNKAGSDAADARDVYTVSVATQARSEAIQAGRRKPVSDKVDGPPLTLDGPAGRIVVMPMASDTEFVREKRPGLLGGGKTAAVSAAVPAAVSATAPATIAAADQGPATSAASHEKKPAWQTDPTVLRVATAIRDGHDWGSLPVLADALEEAGCNEWEWLWHLRSGQRHQNACWAVDLLVG